MCSGLVRLGWLDALGRSIFTACVSSGAVMMKITSSTSMTSISGIMLISAIGADSPVCLKLPNAISVGSLGESGRFKRHHGSHVVDVRAGGQKRKQIMREGVELGEHQAVAAHEG